MGRRAPQAWGRWLTLLSIVLRPEAEQDIAEARDWYEERSAALGQDFVSAVDATVAGIAERPLAFPEVHGATRRAVIRRFPYGVYYRIADREIVILAVMHGHRHPQQWLRRS